MRGRPGDVPLFPRWSEATASAWFRKARDAYKWTTTDGLELNGVHCLRVTRAQAHTKESGYVGIERVTGHKSAAAWRYGESNASKALLLQAGRARREEWRRNRDKKSEIFAAQARRVNAPVARKKAATTSTRRKAPSASAAAGAGKQCRATAVARAVKKKESEWAVCDVVRCCVRAPLVGGGSVGRGLSVPLCVVVVSHVPLGRW